MKNTQYRFTQIALILSLAALTGCATGRVSNTSRTATEQLLLSGAVDDALEKFQFDQLKDQSVFVNDKYLDTVDKGYVVGSLRHRLFESGARIADSADKAEVILEARSAGVGTDSEESYVGVPALGIPGMAIEFPEIKVVNRSVQYGTARLSLVAYDAKSGQALGGGGDAFARSSKDNWYVLGVGPFEQGSLSGAIEQATTNPAGINTACNNTCPKHKRLAANSKVKLVQEEPTAVATKLKDALR